MGETTVKILLSLMFGFSGISWYYWSKDMKKVSSVESLIVGVLIGLASMAWVEFLWWLP